MTSLTRAGPQVTHVGKAGHKPAPSDDRFADWCGWVVIGVLALTPLLAWLGCLGFATLIALAGLLTLPAMRLLLGARIPVLSLALLVGWTWLSATWSPYNPRHLPVAESPKLLGLFLTGMAFLGAVSHSSPRRRQVASALLIYGMVVLAIVLLYEGLTLASLYRALLGIFGKGTRPDLAAKNVAQALDVLILLGPTAGLAAYRRTKKRWPAWTMATGLVVPGIAWSYDAPLLALAIAGLTGLAVYRFPRAAPKVLAVLVSLFFLGTPWILWATRKYGLYDYVFARVEPSWSERMGYWDVATRATMAHPFRGWGLDASRTFTPGIQLHPHDSALQIWLELGLPGALLAALFFGSLFHGLRRPKGDADTAVAAATVAAYLTIGSVSFGVWQEWWLGLGVLAAAACRLTSQPEPSALQVDRVPQLAIIA